MPVKEGATVILIPTDIISGRPSVGGRTVEEGRAIYLTKSAIVEPAFYCFAILIQ
jgi:hypothetical protein